MNWKLCGAQVMHSVQLLLIQDSLSMEFADDKACESCGNLPTPLKFVNKR
jgi:hypothetical protein